MGKNCMSITLPLKFRRQHIKYKHTVKMSKAYFGKNNFALFNCLISLLNFKIYLVTVLITRPLPTLQF